MYGSSLLLWAHFYRYGTAFVDVSPHWFYPSCGGGYIPEVKIRSGSICTSSETPSTQILHLLCEVFSLHIDSFSQTAMQQLWGEVRRSVTVVFSRPPISPFFFSSLPPSKATRSSCYTCPGLDRYAMRATTTPTYIPAPTVMESAARNRALLELIPALEKSPLALALPVWQNKAESEMSQRVTHQQRVYE